MTFASIDEALRRIRRGEMVLVADDEDRENEGDLTMAAEWVSPEAINFMLRWARGLVCMPTAPEYLDRLAVPPMVPPGTAGCDTAFSVSIDHVGSGSGIGAADRAHTIKKIVDLHGGDIHPEPCLPHGCRMVVTLPRATTVPEPEEITT